MIGSGPILRKTALKSGSKMYLGTYLVEFAVEIAVDREIVVMRMWGVVLMRWLGRYWRENHRGSSRMG